MVWKCPLSTRNSCQAKIPNPYCNPVSGWPYKPTKEPYINLHIGVMALPYGQACFEGLKVFCHEDGEVYIFRPDETAKHMQSSCDHLKVPQLPTDSFIQAVKTVVIYNIEYVPCMVPMVPCTFIHCCLAAVPALVLSQVPGVGFLVLMIQPVFFILTMLSLPGLLHPPGILVRPLYSEEQSKRRKTCCWIDNRQVSPS